MDEMEWTWALLVLFIKAKKGGKETMAADFEKQRIAPMLMGGQFVHGGKQYNVRSLTPGF
jgi:hypothetical protein